MKRIKTVVEAFEFLKRTPEYPVVDKLPEDIGKVIISHYELMIVTEALNKEDKGKELDWNDFNQRKWYPWFDMDDDRGFDLDGTDGVSSGSTVTARLCFKNEELLRYATKQFLPLYKAYFKG